MGNLKLAHIIAIDKDSGEPVALVCDANGYVRVTLDTETVTVGGSVLPTGAATSVQTRQMRKRRPSTTSKLESTS